MDWSILVGVWVVSSVCILYALGWWVSIGMVWWGRWVFRLALLALLLGLTLPAVWINEIVVFLSQFYPGLGEISDEPGASFGMHFLLFLAVATTLLVFRMDLPFASLLAALIALAFLTEGLQAPIADRFADWADVGTNLLGVGLGAMSRVLLARLVRPTGEHVRL